MSVTKSERLMNLVICLLASRQYVTKGRLRATLEPYRECASEEAFERMFERDKDELREMGIPLETGSLDEFFDDEIGYRIPPGEYALPDIHFEQDEGAVLGLAARFWQQATLADAASSALLKLKAAGVAISDSPEPGIEPRVRVEAPAFEPLLQAVCDRRPVTFAYRRGDDGQVRRREVEPWAIDSWHGHWYLAGYDRTRQADRVFRLDRIVGPVALSGSVGEFAMPPDVDVRAKVETFARGTTDPEPATLRVRQGTGFPLRRRAERITPEGDGWDVVELALYPGNDGWLAEFGADVIAVEPAELRDAVIARLRAVVKNAAEAADRPPSGDAAGAEGAGGGALADGTHGQARTAPSAARAGGAGAQVRRLLNLVPYLLAHPGAYLAEVAREFNVTEAQLRKDLELLWFVGLPDGLPDDLMEPHVTDGGAIFLRNAEAIIRPLRLSTREAIALLVAVRAIANLPGVGNRDALERAAAKLETACGDAAAASRRVSVSFETEDIVLGTVRWALTEERALHLRYYVPTRDDVTERVVDPIRVVLEDGRAYLDAWCRASVGERRFRLDRVVSLEVLDEPARVPDSVGAHHRGEDGPLASHVETLVTLDVDPACRWVAENYPCERVDELPDGWLRLTMRMTNPGWLRRLVTRLGPAGIIVDPPALATEVGSAARAALARYEADA